MKLYKVVVEILDYHGRVYHERTFRIMAKSGKEAEAIVYNYLALRGEPRYRVKSAEEEEEEEEE